MVFWAGILAGALFALFTIKMGFFETWAMLFNILISIYLAVFLRPIITDIVPGSGNTPYGNALTMVATAAAFFTILHVISYTFFTGQFNVSFPKIFNSLGAGSLGFLAGLLVWSFVSISIYITPISQDAFVEEIVFGPDFEQGHANISYISWWCNLVNKVVSPRSSRHTAEEMISNVLKTRNAKKKVRDKTYERARPVEPNDVKTGTGRENKFSPHRRVEDL